MDVGWGAEVAAADVEGVADLDDLGDFAGGEVDGPEAGLAGADFRAHDVDAVFVEISYWLAFDAVDCWLKVRVRCQEGDRAGRTICVQQRRRAGPYGADGSRGGRAAGYPCFRVPSLARLGK